MTAQEEMLRDRHFEVVVVGGGQAGLSVSWFLKGLGLDHLVIERQTLVGEWTTRRWDSFCLVTPNWQCRLPHWPYAGADPDGFMNRTELCRYLDGYISSFDPPAVEGVEVLGVWPDLDATFQIRTSAGRCTAAQIVVATGPYQQPHLPGIGRHLSPDVLQLHSSQYRNPEALPPGAVLVVGSGQSGCQIAEDLHLAGRQVHLSVGSAPRVARRYRGKDVVAWLDRMDYYAKEVADHPLGEGVRDNSNHYVTGRDGGHDIDLRVFALEGMRLHGRLIGGEGAKLSFADDVGARLDHADAVAEGIKDLIDAYIDSRRIDAPHEERYVAPWYPPDGPSKLDLHDDDVATVVWATGFMPDYHWLCAPVLDRAGRPRHRRGVTEVDGLYFLGLPWQHTWGSARFAGIAADAEYLAGHIARRARRLARSA